MFHGKEYVYEVYKEKSFSKAAQNLYISQPSLSATIKKIEQNIGADIFDRSTVPVQLTECGKKYIKYAERIMDFEKEFRNYVTNLNELNTGSIAIGASSFFTSFILPPIVTAFTKAYPKVFVKLVEATTAQLENSLADGSLDLIIDNYEFDPSKCSAHYLYDEHLILAANKKFTSTENAKQYQLSTKDIIKGKHLKSNVPGVPLEIFKNDPFLLLRSGNDTRFRAEKICDSQKFRPQTALELDQQISAYNLACYGMGLTFISDSLVRHMNPDANMVYYKLDCADSARSVSFYQKAGKRPSKAAVEFLKIASEQLS